MERALEDASRDVRASAIRIAERWLGEANHPIQAAVLKRLDDKDWAVRYQLAASLGAMPPGRRDPAAVALLERHGGDPIAVDAVLSGLRGSEAAVLETMLQAERPQTPSREAVITMLAATIVRSAQDAPVQTLFGLDRRPPAGELAAGGAASRRRSGVARRRDAGYRSSRRRDNEPSSGGSRCPVRRVPAGALVRAAHTHTRRRKTSSWLPAARVAGGTRVRCG